MCWNVVRMELKLDLIMGRDPWRGIPFCEFVFDSAHETSYATPADQMVAPVGIF